MSNVEQRPDEVACAASSQAGVEVIEGRVFLGSLLPLGGPPFGEAIIMWWNFVGRSHEEVVSFREQWQAQVGDGTLSDGPFGVPLGDVLPPIPAPVLPRVRLRERR